MLKTPESWCALVLGATVAAYAVGCFYYFNHGADSLATRYFAYAVYATVVARFLVARRGSGAAGRFSGGSVLLFVAGLLPLVLVGLGVGKQ